MGTFLMSMAVNMIYDPMHLVTGGVAGLAIMVKYITAGIIFEEGIPVWLTTFLLNVPLYIISLKVFGIRYIFKSLIGTASYTFFMYLLPVTPMFEADYLLSAVFGGVLTGLGLGLVLLAQGTTGGTDMLGILIHHKKPYISVPRLLLILDGIIVISGAGLFGMNEALYAVITVYVVTKVSDGLLEGLKFAKCAYIVSDKYQEISDKIIAELEAVGIMSLSEFGGFMHNIHSPEDHTDEVAELKAQYTAIDKLLAMMKQRSDNSATYKEYQERSAFTQKHFRKKNAAAIDAYEEADKYIKEHIKAYYVDGKAPKRSELAALSKQLKDKRKAIMPEHKAYLLKHDTAFRYTRQVRQYLNEQYMKREREKSRQRTQAKHRNKNALE